MNKFLLVLFAALLAIGAQAEEWDTAELAQELLETPEEDLDQAIFENDEEDVGSDDDADEVPEVGEEDEDDEEPSESDVDESDEVASASSSLSSMMKALKSPHGLDKSLLRSFASEVKRIKRKLKRVQKKHSAKRKALQKKIRALAKKIASLKKKIAKATAKIAKAKARARRISRMKFEAKKRRLRAKLKKLHRSLRFAKTLTGHVKGLKGSVLLEETDDDAVEAVTEEFQEHADELSELTNLDVSAEVAKGAGRTRLYQKKNLSRLSKKMLSSLKAQIAAIKSALKAVHKHKKSAHVKGLERELARMKSQLASLLAALKRAKKQYRKFNRHHLHINGELAKLAKIEAHIYKVGGSSKTPSVPKMKKSGTKVSVGFKLAKEGKGF